MSIISKIKDWFRKGGAAVGMLNSLGNIADDDRIATNYDELSRIRLAEEYYRGNYIYQKGMLKNTVRYLNSQGVHKDRNFFSINMTQLCAKRLASICLNSGFTVSLDDKTTDNDEGNLKLKNLSGFVENWLEQSGVLRNLESKLEQGIPTGGFAARPYVDGQQIKVAWARADQFYSLDSNTEEVSQAAIASKSTKTIGKTNYYYTLLEFHTWQDDQYIVTNELYKSNDPGRVGEQVPLGTDDMYTDIEEGTSFSDFKRPLFVYFKTPGQNNLEPESPLGVGFVNNCQNILDAINYAHDSFVWEMRMGRRKVLVPPETLKSDPRDEYHSTSNFDPSQDVYQAVEGLDVDSGKPIVELNPEIRVQEYRQTMDFFLNELESSVGLSAGTFTTDSKGGITTATQVVSENSMTYQTRSSYLNRITKFLTELIQAMLQLATSKEMFDGQKPLIGKDEMIDLDNLQVNIHYDDGVFVDKDKQETQDLQAMSAGAMPVKQFLMRNYGLSEADAMIWIAELNGEAPEAPDNEDENEDDDLNDGDE